MQNATTAALGLAIIGVLIPTSHAVAQAFGGAPDSLTYQGVLTDSFGDLVTDSTYSVMFTLSDTSSGGAPVWTETQSVPTNKGVFNVMLGRVTTLYDVAFDELLWLGVKVADDPEIAPRTPLASVPYALSLRGLRVEPKGALANPISPNLIGGWSGNAVTSGWGSTISGGGAPLDDDDHPAPNIVSGSWATIGGGVRNTAGFAATIAGGEHNTAGGSHATIGGGENNQATMSRATVAGGWGNTSSGVGGAVGGGHQNTASGAYSTIPGGQFNLASGGHSFAAGRYARALHTGSFVWADSTGGFSERLMSTANNQFLVRASGGVGIDIAQPVAQFHVGNADGSSNGLAIESGQGDKASMYYSANQGIVFDSFRGSDGRRLPVLLQPSGGDVAIHTFDPMGHPLHVGTNTSNGNGAHLTVDGVWTNGSSHTFKEGFEPVDLQEILQQVSSLPVTRWRYRGGHGGDHIGPVAEDFRAAFGLGEDERYIGTVDADGVSLAAIKALHELVEKQQVEIDGLRAVVDELRAYSRARR